MDFTEKTHISCAAGPGQSYYILLCLPDLEHTSDRADSAVCACSAVDRHGLQAIWATKSPGTRVADRSEAVGAVAGMLCFRSALYGRAKQAQAGGDLSPRRAGVERGCPKGKLPKFGLASTWLYWCRRWSCRGPEGS